MEERGYASPPVRRWIWSACLESPQTQGVGDRVCIEKDEAIPGSSSSEKESKRYLTTKINDKVPKGVSNLDI